MIKLEAELVPALDGLIENPEDKPLGPAGICRPIGFGFRRSLPSERLQAAHSEIGLRAKK